VTEPNPTSRSRLLLSDGEAAVYPDLVEATYGSAVRLEQERVRYSMLSCALRPSSSEGRAKAQYPCEPGRMANVGRGPAETATPAG